MSFLNKKTIVLGVGGGIAVYRVCELARQLMKRGATVRAVMTPNATQFVAPLTFQALTGQPVLTDLFDLHQDATFGHLVTGRLADLYIVAPATADLIARIRAGFADDAVTTSLLAAHCKVLIAPAMNTAMWENAQAQENVRALLKDPRFSMVGPASGVLADGDVGAGRLSEPPEIVEAAEALLAPQDMKGWRVVVTAGPTREHLDPVRYLSNPSSGRMGYAVARAAAQRGAEVVLISGPVELAPPRGVEVIRVTSAEEMDRATLPRLEGARLFVAAAAVADQRPKERADQKVKKGQVGEAIALVPTPDILARAAAAKPRGERPFLVGFAAETERVLEQAREKLRHKDLDLIAANDVAEEGSGFAVATNRLTLVDRSTKVFELGLMSKEDAAHALLDRVLELQRAPAAR